MAARAKKPTKPARLYSLDEIRATRVFQKLQEALPNLREHEAMRLARNEIQVAWDDTQRAKVNRACEAFRAKLASLGIEGKSVTLVLVTDKHGNGYYDVTSQPGGRKHAESETLPKGSFKVTRSTG
jgi:hypothetical protein